MARRTLLLLLALAGCSERGVPASSAPATMPCGPEKTCDARREYCESINTDVPALPSTYTCRPLPDACTVATPSCACFPAKTRCKNFCRRVATTAAPCEGWNLVCIGGG